MTKIISSPNFEDYTTYQFWIKAVSKRSKKEELSQNMKSGYDAAMKQFLQFMNSKDNVEGLITPDEIISQANKIIEEDEKEGPFHILDTLYSFEDWLQGKEIRGYSKRVLGPRERYSQEVTANHKAFGIIRGFYTHNRIWLPRERRKSFVSKTRKNDQKYAVFLPNGNDEIIPNWDEFRVFLSHLSFRDQVIALSLVSTSQDIGDLLELNIEFIQSQERRKRLFWEGNRGKTVYPFRTFFSEEATNLLRRYITTERKNSESYEKIFITTTGRRVRPSHIAANFKQATVKMGIKISDNSQNPYRPKRLRSIFSTACYQAGIDDNIRHIFMGHKKEISEAYRNMPWQNLEIHYRKVEVLLTVFGSIESEEIALLNEKTQKAVNKIIDLELDNKKLNKEIVILKKEIEVFSDQFKEMIQLQKSMVKQWSKDIEALGANEDVQLYLKGMKKTLRIQN